MGRSGTLTAFAVCTVLLFSAASVPASASSPTDEVANLAKAFLNSTRPDRGQLYATLEATRNSVPLDADPGDAPSGLPSPPGDPGGGSPGGGDPQPPEPEEPGAPDSPEAPESPDTPETEEASDEALHYVSLTEEEIRRLTGGDPTSDPDGAAGVSDTPDASPLTTVIYVSLEFLGETGGEVLQTVRGSALGFLNFLRGFACSFLCSTEGSTGSSYAATAATQVAAASQAAAREAPVLALAVLAATGAGLAGASPGLRRFLRFGAVALLSRIPSRDILKSDARRTIHDIVRENSGIALNEIVEKLSLSRNAVAYHLAVFEHENEIVSVKDGKYRRYFLAAGRYVNGAKVVVSALRNDKTLEVARFIMAHPGSIQKQVCEAIGTSPSATNWHIQRLEKVGLVTKARAANTVQYFPGQILAKYDLTEFGLPHMAAPMPAAAVAPLFAAPLPHHA